MKVKTENFHCIQVGNDMWDCFFGEGWKQHSRFKKKQKFLQLVAGNALSKELYDELLKALV